MDNNPKDNHVQQPAYKRQNVARAYTAGPSEKKEYAGTLPLSPTVAATQRTLTCFECGNQVHYRRECPRLKNRIVEIKPEMAKLVEGCMLWEEEKLTRTLIILQMISMLKERFSRLS
ncbi:reverse transcriptase domain-containing protein [Tanacetum coccineum]